MLTGKPTGKKPLVRPRRRSEEHIRMDLKEIRINTSNWVIRLRIGIIERPCESLGSISHGVS